MASKRKPTRKRDPNQITAAGNPNEDQAVAIARTVSGRLTGVVRLRYDWEGSYQARKDSPSQ